MNVRTMLLALGSLMLLSGCVTMQSRADGEQYRAPSHVRLSYTVVVPQGEWQRNVRRGKGGMLESFTLRAHDVRPSDIPLIEKEAAKYRAECSLGVERENMTDDSRPNPDVVDRRNPRILIGISAREQLTLTNVTYDLQCVRPRR